MFSPIESYKKDLAECNLKKDPAQENVVMHLDKLFFKLEKEITLWEKMTKLFSDEPRIKGLYLWGGVGRGKTYLVDLFFDCLTTERKLRLHYHHFMNKVHKLLQNLKGVVNPLKIIAKQFAKEAKIICFDEFFVSDIGDAMILAGMLDALYKEGVVLVMTSNVVPDALYQNGLQRDRFLPAISLIYKYQEVMHLDTITDYRMQYLQDVPAYYVPLNNANHNKLLKIFHDLVPAHEQTNVKSITVLQREIPVEHLSTGIVWFTFHSICETNRSQLDYIEIGRCYHTIFISDIPSLTDKNEPAARRFISLIDELYEKKVNFFATMDDFLAKLYQGEMLKFEFQRTISRLTEMGSKEYMATNHIC